MTPEQIKALHPESYLQVCELEWLQARARGMRIVVEIGSYLGCSTRALATNPDTLVLAVDDWLGPRDVEMSSEDRLKIWSQWAKVGSFPNVLSLRFNLNHTPLSLFRLHANMVFIDGAHDYQSVKRDIESADFISDQKALICGHDFGVGFEGLEKAVREAFPKFQRGPGSLWYTTK